MFMKINTPEFISAKFFTRRPELDDTNGDINLISINLGLGNLPLIAPSQVHGKNIIHAASKYALPERPEADGILLTSCEVEASLRFADCAPVLIWGNEWVLLLHSGYKGTVLNIVNAGVDEVRKTFGGNALENSGAWVGPCIGFDSYMRRISDEWTTKGMDAFHHNNYRENGEHVYFDLAGEIHEQLRICGINEKNITLSKIDTYVNPECYSYRRGDVKNRMLLHVQML